MMLTVAILLFFSLLLFVWLFGVFRPNREFFSYIDGTITGEKLQILTYARHSWPLSNEGY